MPIRWNTWYAEIDRAIKLKPAINHWIDQLNQWLKGKNQCDATHKKCEWFLTPSDWDMLAKLCSILEVFHQATLELSKVKQPTICKVLPLYKLI
ncbi:hypothetical protein K439DRAFT_1308378, partial [Ramaria rubella]